MLGVNWCAATSPAHRHLQHRSTETSTREVQVTGERPEKYEQAKLRAYLCVRLTVSKRLFDLTE